MSIKILFLAANPTNTSNVHFDEEVREINSGLQRAKARDTFSITYRWAVRTRDVRRAILDERPQIVHFSGCSSGSIGLIFEDVDRKPNFISASALADFFSLFSEHVKCVILNGCYSGTQAEEIAKHISYVIGMGQDTTGKANVEFAIGFYDAMCAGETVEFAYRMGLNALELESVSQPPHSFIIKKENALLKKNKGISKIASHTIRAKSDRSTMGSFSNVKFFSAEDELNPFECGKPVSPDRFYGRQAAIRDIKSRIGGISSQSINIVGLRRSGKTSLIRYIEKRPYQFFGKEQKHIIVTIDFQNRKYQTYEGIYEGLRRGIKKATGEEPWPSTANDDPFETQDGLQSLEERGYRLIVIFDEFETISKRPEFLHSWDDDWRAISNTGVLSTIIASKTPLSQLYTQAQLTSSFHNIFTTTTLGTLEQSEWHRLVQDGFKNNSETNIKTIYDCIDNFAGGLPYYVQLAASLIWKHGEISPALREFKLQARPIFEELWLTLSIEERDACMFLKGISGYSPPNKRLMSSLQTYGLVRSDGRLFSEVFSSFIEEEKW